MPIERSDMIGNTPVAFQFGNDHIRQSTKSNIYTFIRIIITER